MIDVWAAVPVKSFTGAKQRTASILSAAQREILAATMLEDVLAALAGSARLAGILVNTVDPVAADLARRYGARVVSEGALDGHTGAVMGMGRVLAAEGKGGLLTVPGDIPRVTAAEIDAVVAACRPPPSFTIVPAHDELGSNAVLCAPPLAVPLRFGRRQLFSASDRGASAGHRAGDRSIAGDRAGHGSPSRSSSVPDGATPHADANAGVTRGFRAVAR